MPIYEYMCPNCKLKFELLRSLTQAGEEASCPRCHSDAERILSAFAAVSKNESGATTSIGSSCSGCSTSSCSSCGS